MLPKTVLLKPWTIAHNSFVESIRQPIYVVLLLLASGLLVVNPALSAYTLDDDNKLLVDLGLSTIFLGGLVLAAFTTTGVLHREIENKTVITVLSKPVSRPVFIVAKYLGILAAIATATVIWSLVFLLTIRHGVLMRATDVFDQPVLFFGTAALLLALTIAVGANYFYRKSFASVLTFCLVPSLTVAYLLVLCLNKEWQWQSPARGIDTQLLIALFLILEALAILTAVAVAASTRLGQLMTLTVCTLVLMLGLTSPYLFGRGSEDSWLARLCYTIVPNMHFHWLADALSQERAVSLTYVSMVTLYDLFYTAALLGVSMLLFQTRDIG